MNQTKLRQMWNRKRKLVIVLMIAIVVGLFLAWHIHTLFEPIPWGYVGKEEHFDPYGWQDYTDYCKYRYWSVIPFQLDARYHIVSEDEITNIIDYFDNFMSWMRASDRLDEYDFDPACINAGDYIHIDTKEGEPIGQRHYGRYECYTLCFFDRETRTLYYIHNNT